MGLEASAGHKTLKESRLTIRGDEDQDLVSSVEFWARPVIYPGYAKHFWIILNWLILGFSVIFQKKCVYNILIHILYNYVSERIYKNIFQLCFNDVSGAIQNHMNKRFYENVL